MELRQSREVDFSRPFKGFDWSVHVNVTRLIDGLFGEYCAWYRDGNPSGRINDPDRVKRHLTHFVLEAFRTNGMHQELCMGVHLGNSYYGGKRDRYRPRHLSARIVKHVTDFLVAVGHFEMPVKGEWHPDQKKRRTTRFRATNKLMRLCAQHGINPYMIVPHDDPEVIILRAKKKRGQSSGEPIDYEDTPFTRDARENLRRINDFIARHRVDLDITDERERELHRRMLNREDPAKDKYLDLTKTWLRRIFNNASFEQGGRFYGGWWQQIPGDYRVFITINGKRTVQLDYSGMHFAIMYAEMGMGTPMEDPYALQGYDPSLRSHIKKAFNIIINCNTRKAAITAIDGRIRNGELSEELGNGERLIQAFIDAHPRIRDKIASGEGVRGQFTDSRVAERILLKGIDLGLCILPIHDGFITTKGDEFILDKLMHDAFLEITGHSIHIKPETIDLSLLENTEGNDTHWVTRLDGSLERDGLLEGKAISYAAIVPREALWRRLVEGTESRQHQELREKEWKLVHGDY